MFLLKAELMELDIELKNLAMAETFCRGEKHSTKPYRGEAHFKSLITQGPLPL